MYTFRERIRLEANAGGESGGGNQQQAPARAEISPEVIAKITADAQKAAVEAANKEASKNAQKTVVDTIIKAFGGDKEQEQRDKFLNALVEKPEEIFARQHEISVSEAKRQLREELKKEADDKEAELKKTRDFHTEIQKEAKALYEKRPDINHTKANRDLLDYHFRLTDESLPVKERLEMATKEYDAAIGELDKRSVEERIKAAGSVDASSGGNKNVEEKSKTSQETRAEMFAKQREIQAKKRGGHISKVTLT